MDNSERWRTIAVAIFAFCFLAFASRPYLSVDSFKEAAGYEAYAAGAGGANAFYQLTGFIANVIPLGMIAPIFGALAVLFAYLALRELFGSVPALFASALLASAPAFALFASNGIYSPAAMAFAFFALGALLIFKSISNGMPSHIGLGAVSMVLSAIIYPDSALLVILFTVPFALQAFLSMSSEAGKKLAKPAVALVVASAACIFVVGLEGIQSLASSALVMGSLKASLFGVVALFPLAACAIVPYAMEKKRGAKGMHDFAFFTAIISIIASAYLPYAALFGLAFSCAYALKWVLEERENKNAEMAFLAIPIALIFAMVFYARGFEETRALAFGLLVGAVAGFALKFYEGKNAFKKAAYALALFLIFSSFAAGAILSEVQFKEARPEVLAALEWAQANLQPSSSIYGFGIGDEAGYIAGLKSGNQDAEIASFLLGNEGPAELKGAGINYLLVDAAYFDDLAPLRNASGNNAARMDSFMFAGYARDSTTGLTYAIFAGKDSELIAQANEQTGALTASTYQVRRASGETFSLASSRVLLLKFNQSEGLAPYDRMVYPGDSFDTNLFNLYFGEVGGMEQVYPEGNAAGAVRIYKVS